MNSFRTLFTHEFCDIDGFFDISLHRVDGQFRDGFHFVVQRAQIVEHLQRSAN